jgi:kinesin family member 11
MAGHQRQTSGMATRKATLRQPSRRLGSAIVNRSQSPADAMKINNTSLLRAQKSPSAQSTAGSKRKERDYEPTTTEDTSIHVVVRCRGRNEHEVKENSGVVLVTEGVKGKSVELSMGPNAVSNKTYYFDKVFSPAADQAIIFEEVVAPILNEVLFTEQAVVIISD